MSDLATPFLSLGAGNGFPFCPPKVDVSVYDFWVNLAGHKKGDGTPTDLNIWESRRLAARLFRNIKGISADVFAEQASEQYQVTSAETDEEPIERECRNFITPFAKNDFGVTFNRVAGIFSGGIRVVSMYNGDTSNRDNFVGFGILQSDDILNPASGFIGIRSNILGSSESLLLMSSAMNGFASNPTTDVDTAYTQIGDYYFVCTIRVTDGGTNWDISIDAASRTFDVKVTNAGSADGEMVGQFNNFIFWEYD